MPLSNARLEETINAAAGAPGAVAMGNAAALRRRINRKAYRTGLAVIFAQVFERLAVIIGVKWRRFPRWDLSADYEKDACVVGSDGTVCRALRATAPGAPATTYRIR